MTPDQISRIAAELRIAPHQVEATAALLADACTPSFIARYRKERTGGLDEAAVLAVRDRLAREADLERQREKILKAVADQGKLTEALKADLLAARTIAELEDLYLPYRPKPRTRATAAYERGLEPLARRIFEQGEADPALEARAFLDEAAGLRTVEDVLAGARDILAEWINEDRRARARLRDLFLSKGQVRCRIVPGKESEGAKYRDYFDWTEPVSRVAPHRVLAMWRGEKEGFLRVSIAPEESEAVVLLEQLFVRGETPCSEQVRRAAHDSYRRLLGPSLQTEVRRILKERADAEAIKVFAENLRELLLSPPFGPRPIMGIAPGFRTGCKVACLDANGKVLHHQAVFLLGPHAATDEAAEVLRRLCGTYRIEAVAVGNGPGGREVEAFLRRIGLAPHVEVVLVDAGAASVYSVSKAARKELPDCGAGARVAVSLARRLRDPLAELVKVDPRAIGAGQYQHDVDPAALKRVLDDVVAGCVNAVGADVNTADRQLLRHISGLGPQRAVNLVECRRRRGPFHSREQLKEVPGMEPKVFEQAAGFLRIVNGVNPLDASAIHPEHYGVVRAMARDLGCTVADLMQPDGPRGRIDVNRYVSEEVGLATLQDILHELANPGRDPRPRFEAFRFAEGLKHPGDLRPGMKVPGVVTNVTNFGAFVDVGVHQDGLVHISELADGYVKDPTAVVKVHQRVHVTVLEVDRARNRISLSMRRKPRPVPQKKESRPPGRPEAEGAPAKAKADRRPKPLEERRGTGERRRPRRGEGRGGKKERRAARPKENLQRDLARLSKKKPFNLPFRDLAKRLDLESPSGAGG